MAPDPTPVPLGRVGGAALLLASVLLLAALAVLVVTERAVLPGVFILGGLVSVPAVVGAVVGVGAGLAMARTRGPERGVPLCAAALALGHAGLVALSLRPGLDGELDAGDLAGGAVGATGALLALLALAVALPWRTLAVRLVAALGVGVLVLGLLVLRVVAQLT